MRVINAHGLTDLARRERKLLLGQIEHIDFEVK